MDFEYAADGSKALVYYDEANGFLLKRDSSDDLLEGFYAVTLSDNICLGVESDEPIRMRCVNVVEIDGVLHKFEMDGTLRGRITEVTDGNTT